MPTQTLPTPQSSGGVVVNSVTVPLVQPPVSEVPRPHVRRISESAAFSFREARRILGGLFVHRPAVYWADMLVTLTIGYGFAAIYLRAPAFSPMQLVSFFIAGF